MLRNKVYYSLFFVLCFLTSAQVWAQTAEVRGFLYSEKNGEPLIYSDVRLFSGSQFLQGAKHFAERD